MRRLFYELSESIRIAWTQIRANKMRSILTALGVIIGIIAQRASLSYAISIASVALVAASALLLYAIFFTVGKDVERLRHQLES